MNPRRRRAQLLVPLAMLLLSAAAVTAQDNVDPADAVLSGDPADAILDSEPVAEPSAAPAAPEPSPESAPAAEPAVDAAPEPPAESTPAPEPALDAAPQPPAPAPADAPQPEPVPEPEPEADVGPMSAVTAPAESPVPPPAAEAATPPADAAAPVSDVDPADALLDAAPAAATAPAAKPAPVAADAAAADAAEAVLAADATAPAATTAEAYSVLRKTIEAPVQVGKLMTDEEMIGGILIRRGRKGARGAPSQLGFTGTFRAISADLPPAKSFRFGSHFGFYYLPDHWDETTQAHIDAIGYFGYSVRDDVELRIAGVASGHHSGTIARYGQDALFQTLGDVYIGGKYAREILPFLHVGGVADLRFFTRVGSFLLRPDASSFALYALGTLDLYRSRWFPRLSIPLRAHATLGYTLDRSASVLGDVENQNASTFGGFGLAPGDQLPLILAAELIMEPFSYFAEYNMAPVLVNRNESATPKRPTFTQSTQRLTLGWRWNPLENIIVDAAIDTSYGFNTAIEMYGQKEAPGPSYMLHFGGGYEWNPEGFEVIDMRGRVVGLVVDAETGEPLGGAIIEYLDNDQYSTQLADETTGQFSTYGLPPGEILLRVQVEGYEPVIINPTIEGKETREEKVFLRRPDQADAMAGALVGTVLDQDGNPVTAVVRFLGIDLGEVRADPNDGTFVKILPQGEYDVEISAVGYETKVYRVPIQAKRRTSATFELLSGASLGALAGTVVDALKRPLQATITFLDAQIDPLQTDAVGRFEKVLPPGAYGVEVRARGFVAKQYRVPVERGKRTVVDVELEEEKQVGMLAGRILAESGAGLAGVITFAKPGVAPVPSDPTSGYFEVMIDAGTYEITVGAPDHSEKRYRIPVLAGKKTVQDFTLVRTQEAAGSLAFVEGGKLVVKRDVEFEPGSTSLREDAYPVLDAVIKGLYSMPSNMRLRLVVHTHNLGPADANLKLSRARAEQIVQYLIESGVERGRVEAVGMGEDQPAVPYDAAGREPQEIRETNERVEFSLVR